MAARLYTAEKVKELFSTFLHSEKSKTQQSAEPWVPAESVLRTSVNDATCKVDARSNSVVIASDRDAFIDRVNTYNPLRWFAKPAWLSPPHCSRYGWICVSTDLLQCTTCQSFLCARTPPATDPQVYAECCRRLSSLLTSAHSSLCPWSSHQSSASFLSLPTTSQTEAFTEAAESAARIRQLDHMIPILSHTWDNQELSESRLDALVRLLLPQREETVDTCAPTPSDPETTPQDAQIMMDQSQTKPQNGDVQLAPDVAQPCDDDTLHDTSEDAALSVDQTAALLAVCGWTVKENARDQLHCVQCNRRVGLWGYHTRHSRSVPVELEDEETPADLSANQLTDNPSTNQLTDPSTNQFTDYQSTNQLAETENTTNQHQVTDDDVEMIADGEREEGLGEEGIEATVSLLLEDIVSNCDREASVSMNDHTSTTPSVSPAGSDEKLDAGCVKAGEMNVGGENMAENSSVGGASVADECTLVRSGTNELPSAAEFGQEQLPPLCEKDTELTDPASQMVVDSEDNNVDVLKHNTQESATHSEAESDTKSPPAASLNNPKSPQISCKETDSSESPVGDAGGDVTVGGAEGLSVDVSDHETMDQPSLSLVLEESDVEPISDDDLSIDCGPTQAQGQVGTSREDRLGAVTSEGEGLQDPGRFMDGSQELPESRQISAAIDNSSPGSDLDEPRDVDSNITGVSETMDTVPQVIATDTSNHSDTEHSETGILVSRDGSNVVIASDQSEDRSAPSSHDEGITATFHVINDPGNQSQVTDDSGEVSSIATSQENEAVVCDRDEKADDNNDELVPEGLRADSDSDSDVYNLCDEDEEDPDGQGDESDMEEMPLSEPDSEPGSDPEMEPESEPDFEPDSLPQAGSEDLICLSSSEEQEVEEGDESDDDEDGRLRDSPMSSEEEGVRQSESWMDGAESDDGGSEGLEMEEKIYSDSDAESGEIYPEDIDDSIAEVTSVSQASGSALESTNTCPDTVESLHQEGENLTTVVDPELCSEDCDGVIPEDPDMAELESSPDADMIMNTVCSGNSDSAETNTKTVTGYDAEASTPPEINSPAEDCGELVSESAEPVEPVKLQGSVVGEAMGIDSAASDVGVLETIVSSSNKCTDEDIENGSENNKRKLHDGESAEVMSQNLVKSEEPPRKKRKPKVVRSHFCPISEHRSWCPWVAKTTSPPTNDTTECQSHDSESKPGWLSFVDLLLTSRAVEDSQMVKMCRMTPSHESLRNIRDIMKQWTPPKVNL